MHQASMAPTNVVLCSLPAKALAGLLMPAAVPPSFGGASPADGGGAHRPSGHGILLGDAIQTAVEHNWDLVAEKSNINLVHAQEMVAKEFPNPTLSIGTTKVNVDGRSSKTGRNSGFWNRNYDNITAVDQLIELGGKRTWRQMAAKQGLLSAEASFQDAERQLKNGVIKAYAKVMQEDELVAILMESEETLKDEAEITSRGWMRAMCPMLTSSRSTSPPNALRLTVRWRNPMPATRGSRWNCCWVPVNRRARSIYPRVFRTWRSSWPQKRPARRASVPDLLAAEAMVKQIVANIGLQKAVRVPDVTVQLHYVHEPPDQPNTAGVGFSIPFLRWNRNQGAIAAAQAPKESAELTVAKVRSQVIGEANQSGAIYQSANDKWKRYVTAIGPKSHDSLAALTYAYRKGGIPLVALLTAQRNDHDIHTASAQAVMDTVAAAADVRATRPYLKGR